MNPIARHWRLRTLVITALSLVMMGGYTGAAMAAVSAPAVVPAHGNICNANGNKLCLDTVDFNLNRNITGTTGNGRTFDAPQAGTQGVIQFSGASNRCIRAFTNILNIQIGACSGVTGIIWVNSDNGDGTRSLTNVHFSGRVIRTDNVAGDITIAGAPGCCDQNGYTWWRMQPIQ